MAHLLMYWFGSSVRVNLLVAFVLFVAVVLAGVTCIWFVSNVSVVVGLFICDCCC